LTLCPVDRASSITNRNFVQYHGTRPVPGTPGTVVFSEFWPGQCGGMDFACRCDRAACARRSGLRQLHRPTSCTWCCWNHILVQRRRLETPDWCFSTPTSLEKAALATLRLPSAAQPGRCLRTCIPHAQLHEHTADQAERSAHRPTGRGRSVLQSRART
jgi:hypothetical protein